MKPEEKLNHMAQDLNQNSSKRRLRRSRSAPRDSMYDDHVKIVGPNKIPMLRGLSISTFCFYLVRDQISGLKTNGSVYFCIVTMTTVGYGDLVPNSSTSRLLACAFVFSGMLLVGLLLSRAADYLVEKQETLLVRAFHLRKTLGATDIFRDLHTNKLRYKCYVAFLVLVLLFLAGTVFLAMFEKMTAFYCVCSTVTTLGYGDKSFSSETGRLFAVFWILTSTICLAQFFLYVAELHAENKQRDIVRWVLTRRILK